MEDIKQLKHTIIDYLVIFISGSLLISFTFSVMLCFNEFTLDFGLYTLLLELIIWIATLTLNNRRLEKWHKWYDKNKNQYVLRRRVWELDCMHEMYSSFEYQSLNENNYLKWY